MYIYIKKNKNIYIKKCLDYNKRQNDDPKREEPDHRQLSTYCIVHSIKSLGTAQNTHKHTFSLSLSFWKCAFGVLWRIILDVGSWSRLILVISALGDSDLLAAGMGCLSPPTSHSLSLVCTLSPINLQWAHASHWSVCVSAGGWASAACFKEKGPFKHQSAQQLTVHFLWLELDCICMRL